VPPGHRALRAVGSEVSLWQPLLLDWVIWMRRSLRDIALRVHVDVPHDLINQVASGLIDVAIMYAPQHLPGLQIDLLMEEELVLATTDPDAPRVDDPNYIQVDWGPDFILHHDISFPEASPSLSANLGPLALSYVLAVGGSGYFRRHAVQPYLDSGKLHLLPDAPRFSYPVYAVHSANADAVILEPALDALRTVAAAQFA
jgi:DNA-binding transcriptional LysR family regulator